MAKTLETFPRKYSPRCLRSGCRYAQHSAGVCFRHYQEAQAELGILAALLPGVPRPKRPEDIGYHGALKRVRRGRGNADIYRCRCGVRARVWRYRGGPRGIVQVGAEFGPYSPDPADYEPVCSGCFSYLRKSLHRNRGRNGITENR